LLPGLVPAVAILLFSQPSRLPSAGTHTFEVCLLIAGPTAWIEALGNEVMARLNALLQSTRSRIGQRLSQIVAIAAASLPAAGA
jgi:hypothetical protein